LNIRQKVIDEHAVSMYFTSGGMTHVKSEAELTPFLAPAHEKLSHAFLHRDSWSTSPQGLHGSQLTTLPETEHRLLHHTTVFWGINGATSILIVAVAFRRIRIALALLSRW